MTSSDSMPAVADEAPPTATVTSTTREPLDGRSESANSDFRPLAPMNRTYATSESALRPWAICRSASAFWVYTANSLFCATMWASVSPLRDSRSKRSLTVR